MIRYNNDYNRGAHPEILKVLVEDNNNAYGGYGKDEWCEKASAIIKDVVGDENANIHFLVAGTQTNFIVLSAMLRHPFNSVISVDSGHIVVHESGAVENTGHKVETVPGVEGKLNAAQVEDMMENCKNSPTYEHITHPKAVYISYPTEFGTIYSLEELEDLRKVCDKYGLYLYIDGARLGYGLAASNCDLTIKDIHRLSDAYYIGGTKCGNFMGEAVVIKSEELNEDFRNYMKMNGALLAKGWLIGMQYAVQFRNGLYFDITEAAVRKADKIQEAFEEAGFELFIKGTTNQLFYALPKKVMDKLAEEFIFEFDHWVDENHGLVRFCTSWATTDEEADALIKAVRSL